MFAKQLGEGKSANDMLFSFHNNELNIFQHKDALADNKLDEINELKSINNIQLGGISEQESNIFKNNIQNKSNILIGYNKQNKKFIFKNDLNKYLGSFTIMDIINYIASTYDKNINNESKYIIETFIGLIDLNDNYANINLLNYTKSPFMGDLEMIIILNNNLAYYIKNELLNNLENFNEKYKDKIKDLIKIFIYKLLNYTLSLINLISYNLNDNQNEIKIQLLKYSNIIIQFINEYIYAELNNLISQNKYYHELLTNNLKIKNKINYKIDFMIQKYKKNKM